MFWIYSHLALIYLKKKKKKEKKKEVVSNSVLMGKTSTLHSPASHNWLHWLTQNHDGNHTIKSIQTSGVNTKYYSGKPFSQNPGAFHQICKKNKKFKQQMLNWLTFKIKSGVIIALKKCLITSYNVCELGQMIT